MRVLPALFAVALASTPLAALADAADGQFHLPKHALAASDDVGAQLFLRSDNSMVTKPRFMEQAEPTVQPPANQMPEWPESWNALSDDEY